MNLDAFPWLKNFKFKPRQLELFPEHGYISRQYQFYNDPFINYLLKMKVVENAD